MAGFGRRKSDEIHLTPDVSHIRNPDVAYEHSDVPVTPVLKFVGALVVFFIVVCVAMLLMFKVLEARAVRNELEASPLERRGDERLPPEPRLQIAPGWSVEMENGQRKILTAPPHPSPDPNAEYREVRKEWDEQMSSAGFIDQNAGTVRIPIEQAKQMYLQRQAQKMTQQPGAAAVRAAPEGQGAATTMPAAQGRQAVGEQIPAAASSGRTPIKSNQ